MEWLVKYRGDVFNVLGLGLSVYALLSARNAVAAVQALRNKIRRSNVVRVLVRAGGILEVLTGCKDNWFPQRYCDDLRLLLIEIVDSTYLSDDDREMIKLHLGQIRQAPKNMVQTVAFFRKIQEELGRLAAVQRNGLEDIL